MYFKWTSALFLLLSSFPIISWAQQNLFNVPSSDITEEHQLFFQQQFNFTNLGISNTTLDYGLGNDLEVGINFFNLDMAGNGGGAPNPNLLFNFQKAVNVNRLYTLSFGTQTGFSPALYNPSVRVPSFSYVSNALDLDSWGKYYLGGYFANHAYTGSAENVGFMLGIDYPLIDNAVHLMGDLISGNSGISVAVLGTVFFLPNGWQLSVGAQLPSPGSQNNFGMVFEITKL